MNPEGETTADLFALPRSRYADPKFSWFESIGVTGIVFLNSAELGPEHEHNMFVGDYVFGNLSRFELNQKRNGFLLFDNLADKIANNSNERNDARIGEGFGSISALHVGPDGFLYVVSISDGSVYAVHPVVQVAAATVPHGVMGSAYNADLTVSGGTGPYTLTVLSGGLPPGLSITGTAITGTPTEIGNFSFTLQIAETGGAVSVKSYSVEVHKALSLRTKKLHKGRAGRNYVARLTATGGNRDYTWSIAAGALPAGLSLNPASGKITGIPAAPGLVNFNVQVTDSLGASAQRALSITVN